MDLARFHLGSVSFPVSRMSPSILTAWILGFAVSGKSIANKHAIVKRLKIDIKPASLEQTIISSGVEKPAHSGHETLSAYTQKRPKGCAKAVFDDHRLEARMGIFIWIPCFRLT
jgi:hypothetical protein